MIVVPIVVGGGGESKGNLLKIKLKMEATVVKCSLLFHGVSFALWHVKPTKLILL